MRSATGHSASASERARRLRVGPLRAPAALLAAALALGCSEPPPSLLLVTLDTLRRDHVGAYGAPESPTPALDALAAEGLVHEAAYTTMPTTGPAHLSLFTGLYPSEHGARGNGEPLPGRLRARELAARLRGRGYATAAFVSSLLLAPPATGLRGFEIYDSPGASLRPGEETVRAALAWLDAERRRPVFLWVHLYDPHAPYGSADEKRPSLPVDPRRHGWVDRTLYASPEARARMAERYARGVDAADRALGRLVAGARRRLEPPPLVAVVADHGESLDEHLDERGFAYDHGEFLDPESVEIPLVLAGPGVAPGRSRAPVSIRDLYATLLAAAGLPDPAGSGEADPDEAAAERRDLRAPSAAPGAVRIERRRLAAPLPGAELHAAAAADGRRLVRVAEDGRPAPDGHGGEAAGLVAEARRGLAPPGAPAASVAVDPETLRALRELGYTE